MKWCIMRTILGDFYMVEKADPKDERVVAVFGSKKKAEKALDIAERAYGEMVLEADMRVYRAEAHLREARRIMETCMTAIAE